MLPSMSEFLSISVCINVHVCFHQCTCISISVQSFHQCLFPCVSPSDCAIMRMKELGGTTGLAKRMMVIALITVLGIVLLSHFMSSELCGWGGSVWV